ncbi:unnamed protein product [Moneuplotes crassus]|uniref:Uncharacterized protein n=1 Tax=Euplotes crassus TaxID=5936 RepID=A0AAD2D5H3_EUPCR|nr:unnamed protein product [Moneuplotes crassus]
MFEKEYQKKKNDNVRLALAIAHHLIPVLVVNLDLVLSQFKFKKSDFVYIFIFGILFCINNFAQTKLMTRDPYDFLTWESYDSLYVVFGLAITFGLFYLVLCCILDKLTTTEEKEKAA